MTLNLMLAEVAWQTWIGLGVGVLMFLLIFLIFAGFVRFGMLVFQCKI